MWRISAEDPKLRMRSIRFTIFYSIYLLSNKKLECGRTSVKRCYTQGYYTYSWSPENFMYVIEKIVLYAGGFCTFSFQAFGRIFLFAGCCFLFNILFIKYCFDTSSCFWSSLLYAGCFFFVHVESRKHWFEVFSSFSSSFLLSAFPLKLLVFTVNLSRKPKTQNAVH